ncbi:MAG: hypothetical protein WCE49_18510 [Terrimicrobiaceae bacterium]
MLEISLNPGVPGARRLRLRTLEGRDELNLDPHGRTSFCDFVDALAVKAAEGYLLPGRARELPVSDLETIAAVLHGACYGERVESLLKCDRCGRGFDVSFDLGAVLRGLGGQRDTSISGPDENGVFTLRDGRQFRLPTGADELAVADLGLADATRELRSRCVIHGDFEADPDVLDAAMEACGPLVSQDLSASCPHCRANHTTRFQVRPFLLHALASERRFLNYEIHWLARSYGWSRTEILGMTRDDRRLHAKLVLPAD